MIDEIDSGNNLLIHCRGGVGRAGTVAGCILGHYIFKSPESLPEKLTPKNIQNIIKKIYSHVRKIRCAQAIECRRQEEFIANYVQELAKNIVLPSES